jgi:hypothetical protein
MKMDFRIVTEEEQETNFLRCMDVLKACNCLTELTQLGTSVYKYVEENMYLMSKEHKDIFWSKYREKKERLSSVAA